MSYTLRTFRLHAAPTHVIPIDRKSPLCATKDSGPVRPISRESVSDGTYLRRLYQRVEGGLGLVCVCGS
jgi:hypothetical protein